MGFLDDYRAYTDYDWYPPSFHRALGMLLVGLAVGRRAWVQDGRWPVYPLMHVIMIADSGVGKGACVEVMYRVQREGLPGLIVARKEGSAAGLLKRLPVENGRQVSPLLIEAAEMTTLLNRMDYLSNMIPVLTELADNNRYGKSLKDGFVDIEDIQTSLVLGTNERALRERFSSSIIEEGLASRLTWLTARWEPKPIVRRPDSDEEVEGARQCAVAGLSKLGKLSGPVQLDGPATNWFASWQAEWDSGPPADRQLSGYYSRRYIHLLRAALTFSLSDYRLVIGEADMVAAWEWVRGTERQMLEVFGSLRLSAYGKWEEGVYDWLAGKQGGATWTEIYREWNGRLAGKESVRRLMESLEQAGRVRQARTERGGGVRWQAMTT